MICPRCGNEVHSGEVFCGQCGAPSNPQGSPSEKDNARLTHSGHLPVAYGNSMPLQSRVPNPPTQTPPSPHNPHTQASGPAFSGYSLPGQPKSSVSGQNQRTGFYHGATEAFVTPPSAFIPPQPQNPSNSVVQRSFPGSSQYGNIPPVQAGNPGIHTPSRPQSYPGVNSQGYGYSRPLPPAPARRKQQHSAIVPIVGICLAIAVISVIGLLTVIFTKPHSDPSTSSAVVTTAATIPTAVATPIPTATPVPTVAPDAGFTWCAATCRSNNFNLEYPVAWSAAPSTITNGMQFIDPAQADILMTVKAPGPDSGSATAGQLLVADLQTNYATLPGYTPPATTQTATLGGETWEVGIVYYQGATNTRERLVIYVTVHQGNIYIIEMQAPDAQFDSINTSYYVLMTSKFAFLQ